MMTRLRLEPDCCVSAGGLTVRTITFVAPRASTCFSAWALAPSPMLSMAITLHTPNTIPSIVSPLRSLCSIRLLSASRTARTVLASGTGGEKA